MRYGLRMLRRSPGFAAAAVMILGLGLGANTALFSLIDAVLVRQMPFAHADRLVWIWSTRTDRDKAFYSVPDFIETRAACRSLEDMAAYANWGANLTGSGDAERFAGARITANAFTMMGVRALYGRTIEAGDVRSDAERVVVLRHGLWQRRFGGDPGAIGRMLTLNGHTYRIAGVLPQEFVMVGTEAELFVPFNPETDRLRNVRETNLLRTMGLLKPGVSVPQAAAELAAISRRLREQYPETNGKHTAPRVQLFRDEVTGGYRRSLWTLLGAVTLVLLIACSNLANLLLARAASRRREVAVRSALGASRMALFRQFLGESLVLAVLGGAMGILLARVLLGLLVYLAPADLPRLSEVTLDARVLAYAALVTIGAGILFGVAPALHASRLQIVDELRARSGAGAGQNALRSVIVVAEVAFSMVLLIAAGLFLRTFLRTQAIHPGFSPDHLMVLRISVPQPAYGSAAAIRRFYDALRGRVLEQRGVESVALASYVPLSAANSRNEFLISGRTPSSPLDVPAAQNRWVSAGYFRTMRIPIREGREFTDQDIETSAGVAMVDEPVARKYWPGRSPVGSHFRMDGRDFEVVGVAGTVKHATLDEEPTGTVYVPFTQVTAPALPFFANGFDIVTRNEADPRALATAVRRELRALDPNVPASSSKTMDEAMALAVGPRRFNLRLVSVFAAAALLLAAMGLYAVVAYSVSLRTGEIGVRMALGADAGSVARMIVGQGLRMVAAGIAVGIAGAMGASRLVEGLLFETNARDPVVFAVVAGVFLVVGAGAAWMPARRAARVDAVVALRGE